MSGIIWHAWTYCNRLITYSFYDDTVCVNNKLIQSTSFCLSSNSKYPITKYCTYCGNERFTDDQIRILTNPKTTYKEIYNNSDLRYMLTKNVHPIICTNKNCLMGLYNLSYAPVPAYDLDDILSHTHCSISSATMGEILEKFESDSIDQTIRSK